MTSDARFIFTEPVYVLDVRRWEQYALSDARDFEAVDAEALSPPVNQKNIAAFFMKS